MSGAHASEPVEEPDAAAPRRAGRLTWGGAAWLFVLAAIGIVQVVRGQWIDAVIFGGAATALAADAAGLIPAGAPRSRPRSASLLAAGAAFAGVLSLAPRHGVVAAIAVLAVGIAALLIAWPPAPPRGVSPWPRALRELAIWWAAIWIVGCLWELAQFILGGLAPGGRGAHPALSDLLDPVVAPGIGQVVFAVAWVAAGVFLVVRGGAR